ncbi:hypothetical protein CI753_08200 [Klebsiella pneumoniae subsp. pneumoniae]|nr:hypothetical protein CI753_08200 [Klebsiella pneumoniae subsp. pneumoniae]
MRDLILQLSKSSIYSTKPLNWQKESTHLALNQIISIYLTGSGMAIISRITPLYFYRHPLSR